MPDFKRPHSFVETFFENHKWEYEKYQFLKDWERMVGKTIASHSQAYALKGQTLYVAVDDPLWLTELRYSEKTIIEKYVKSKPEISLEKIVFRFGQVDKASPFRMEAGSDKNRFLREATGKDGFSPRRSRPPLPLTGEKGRTYSSAANDYFPRYHSYSNFLNLDPKRQE